MEPAEWEAYPLEYVGTGTSSSCRTPCAKLEATEPRATQERRGGQADGAGTVRNKSWARRSSGDRKTEEGIESGGRERTIADNGGKEGREIERRLGLTKREGKGREWKENSREIERKRREPERAKKKVHGSGTEKRTSEGKQRERTG
ncbi:hypothetical protein NDU88_012152 [Pleurodeles waltl]|uniref:Uncharacterized protein n=1 Tax=Pleurodeles waltl TaxID=8319 RepID=A0AAV7R161_PLEWA|nr:hypothetical protein NDU88_012152 [Pleurodeles waltl]